ncbi:MAG: hypothetical protein JOY79_01230 [Acidobacteriaceae bacterium]|nr:hypothetical protein [Acidobacteriaceae bacterium]
MAAAGLVYSATRWHWLTLSCSVADKTQDWPADLALATSLESPACKRRRFFLPDEPAHSTQKWANSPPRFTLDAA